MSDRVLTQRELNRALLARQLLLERARLTPVRALEAVAGLQAQEPKAPYLGLWTRLDGFERQALTRAIHRRTVVKATQMRATLHLVSTRDYALFQPALAAASGGTWHSYRTGFEDAEALAARAAAFAQVRRSTVELREHLGGDQRWWRVSLYTPLIRAPTGEDWAFGPRTSWIAAGVWLDRPLGDADDGLAHLVRRYLAAFGPASRQDIGAWSGLPVAALAPALAALSARLRRFRDERGRELLDVRGAPLPPAETPAPPRLLPPFDNVLLSYADRTRVMADDVRRTVIRGGAVDAVFLVDGFVAGRWQLDRKGFRLEPFGRLAAQTRRALLDEGERLRAFVA